MTITNIAKWVIPYHLWNHLREFKLKRNRAQQKSRLVVKSSPANLEISYATMVDFLVRSGCDQEEVINGSIPEQSLHYVIKMISQNNPGDIPLLGLHIGNFVGVSLAVLTLGASKMNPLSLMVSIDPNITHRGISNPLNKVLGLLEFCGVESRSVILTGYSMEKSIANDGLDYTAGKRLSDAFVNEPSCSNQIENLAAFSTGKFDFIVIDGNHEGPYLKRELEKIDPLLKPSGLLILDDVSPNWFEVERVFTELSSSQFEKIGADGRVGVVRKRSKSQS